MKRLYNFIPVIAAGMMLSMLPACTKDFLNKEPVSDLTTGNFYKNAHDAEAALLGAYNGLMDQYYIWDYIINEDVRADNCYAGGDNPDNFQIDNFQLTAVNGNVTRDWQGLYAGILKANAVIDHVPDINDPAWEGNDRKAQIIGEAKFLRAFHYYWLVTTWGGVPLVLSINDQDIYKSRSSAADVYAQIEKDLLDAESVLPTSYSTEGETRGRATKGAAEGLLAKVYAQEGKYQECLDMCNKVIANPNYSLLDNYADLFDGNHPNSSESIFEIQHNTTGEGSYGPQLMLPYSVTGDQWIKFNTPSHDLVNAFRAAGDSIRLHASILFEQTDFVPSPYTAGEPIPYIYKWKHANGWNSGDNQIMIRLADIILLKAEALNELGQTPQAIPLINQIRTRVDLPNTTAVSKEQVKQAILDERRLELAFEGDRWNDLLRAGTDYTLTVMKNLKDGQGQPLNYSINENKLLFPVPQNDRDLNSNLTQNPGY